MNSNDFSNIIALLQCLLISVVTLNIPTFISSSFKSNEKYKLNKDKKLSDYKSVFVPKEVVRKYDNVDTTKFSKINYGNYIIEFINEIKKISKEEDLTYLYNNFSSLDISIYKNTIPELFKSTTIMGEYSTEKNKIKMQISNEPLIKYILIHELFHCSSTTVEQSFIFSGFSQFNRVTNKSVGYYFNEGYTQYLTEKTFMKNGKIDNCYFIEKNIAKLVELIVGKDMFSLYLRADFNGLINELARYDSVTNIRSLFNMIEYVCESFSSGLSSVEEKEKIFYLMKKIYSYLLYLYIRKNEIKSTIKMSSKKYDKFVNAFLRETAFFDYIDDPSYGIKEDDLITEYESFVVGDGDLKL